MGSDIESFMCLLMRTEYLNELLFKNSQTIEKYADVIGILENWERYKTVEDVKKENNEHINKAIEELENNDKMMKILKEETSLYK